MQFQLMQIISIYIEFHVYVFMGVYQSAVKLLRLTSPELLGRQVNVYGYLTLFPDIFSRRELKFTLKEIRNSLYYIHIKTSTNVIKFKW